MWGDTKQLNNTDDNFSVHEAWGELLFSGKLSLKAGRQEIVYDDSRIFGNVGWAQQGRSHDAALVKYQSGKFKLHAGFAMNQDAEKLFESAYEINNYKAFQYLWGHYKEEKWNLSALFLNNGMELTEVDANGMDDLSVNYSQTMGLRFTAKPSAFSFALAGYIQSGEAQDGTDINAHYFKVDAGYKLTDCLSANVGIERISGTDQDSDDNENNSFTPFYGTNHKFNGWMDYFFVGNHLNSVGLNDMYLSLNYKKNKIASGITAHIFSAYGNVMDPEDATNTMDSGLGTEIDYNIKYKHSKNASLALGYSYMIATDTMEVLKGGDADENASWLWMMITIKPKFL